MPLVNTVEHHESTSSSHQTAVNGRWSEPKTSYSSSANVTTNRADDNNNNISIKPTMPRRSDMSSPIGGYSSSTYNPPPPLIPPRISTTVSAGVVDDMDRRSRELEQGFWNRVNESRSRLGFPNKDAAGVGGTSPFSSVAPALRTSPTPASYRSTSSASSAYNNNNNNNNTNFSNGYTTRATPFNDNDLLPSHMRTAPSSLLSGGVGGGGGQVVAFPDNLDDITRHTKDLAVQGIESSIEDIAGGLKLMRWGFDVQGFEPHEIHVKTVGDEQLEIHGKHEEKTGNYSNYAEFTKSVSLPPNTRFDEMRSVFDTRSQRLTVEAPFKPLRQPTSITSTGGALDFNDSGIHDNYNYSSRATPPPTTVGVNQRYSNIPIGLTSKQRESYRSTTSSSSSAASNNKNLNYTTKYDYSPKPYTKTGAIERSSSAHNNNRTSSTPSRSPMGVRFEDEDRSYKSYSRDNNGNTTTIPVRYAADTTTSAKSRFMNNNNNNVDQPSSTYISPYNTDYGRGQQPPVVKTSTEYSRRVHESTLNETRPAGATGTTSNGYGNNVTRRIGYQRPLSNDRMDVRVESVGD